MKKLAMLTFSNTHTCNFACVYCSTNAGKKLDNELSLSEKKDLINQAQAMGISFILLCGTGEPMCDPDFDELFDYITSKKIRLGLTTNGSLITPEYAGKFFKHNTYLLVKCTSLNKKTNDLLLRPIDMYTWDLFRGIFIPSGIAALLNAGFNTKSIKTVPTFEIETVITKKNLPDIPAVARFCKDTNTALYIDTLLWLGRAKRNKGLLLCSEYEHQQLFRELVKIFGFRYVLKEFFYRCSAERNPTVSPSGEVHICHLRPFSVGSIRSEPLSNLFQKAQSLRKKQDTPFYKYLFRFPTFRTCPAREYYKKKSISL